MQIHWARHGNTFGPGDPVVWVGASQDLELVERGREQALELAEALQRHGVELGEVRCGPLVRTREFARIVTERLGLAEAKIDQRLDEIDYGEWSGKSDVDVVKEHGREVLQAWREYGVAPQGMGWNPEPDVVRAELESLVQELAAGPHDAVLCVTSNGRLRYALELVQGALERAIADRGFSMRTGRCGRIDIEGTERALSYWNVDPRQAERL